MLTSILLGSLKIMCIDSKKSDSGPTAAAFGRVWSLRYDILSFIVGRIEDQHQHKATCLVHRGMSQSVKVPQKNGQEYVCR